MRPSQRACRGLHRAQTLEIARPRLAIARVAHAHVWRRDDSPPLSFVRATATERDDRRSTVTN